MSLLWPDKVVGGLFPGQCWLRRAAAEETHALAQGGPGAAASMLAALGEMLDGQGAPLRKGSKVSLVVSDSLGALAALPWHAQLTTPDEVNGYALACFEKQGIVIGEGWAMHAQFRTHGGMGLAYALPKEWLNALVAMLEARGLRLDRVLPLTAMAYWRVTKLAKPGQELVLLREPQRISAMVHDRSGLLGLDVETITGNAGDAGQRLLRRLGAYYPDVSSVRDWSSTVEEGAVPLACIAECLPDAVLAAVNRNSWS